MPSVAAGSTMPRREKPVRRGMAVGVLAAAVLMAGAMGSHGAWPQGAHLRVATIERVPFVVKRGTGFIGYSIELWDAVAKELVFTYELVEFDVFADMLAAVKRGDVDIAVANISVTASREREMNFSHGIFNAGLRILFHKDLRASPSWRGLLFSSGVLYTFCIALVILVIVAHLAWIIERHDVHTGFHQSYLKGIGDGFWWAAVTVTTIGYGDKSPRTVPGRVLGVVWMLAGVLLLGTFIGQISSSFATVRLGVPIAHPADLATFKIATVRGSTADRYLAAHHLDALRYDAPQQMFASILQGKADAAVFDAPILAYFAASEGRGNVRLAGPLLKPEKFGFALPTGSPYRERINRALLKLQENGTAKTIYAEWFGIDP